MYFFIGTYIINNYFNTGFNIHIPITSIACYYYTDMTNCLFIYNVNYNCWTTGPEPDGNDEYEGFFICLVFQENVTIKL